MIGVRSFRRNSGSLESGYPYHWRMKPPKNIQREAIASSATPGEETSLADGGVDPASKQVSIVVTVTSSSVKVMQSILRNITRGIRSMLVRYV